MILLIPGVHENSCTPVNSHIITITLQKIAAGCQGIGIVCSIPETHDDALFFKVVRSALDSSIVKRGQLAHSLLNCLGIGPKLTCHFTNGMCMEYIKGKCLSSTGFGSTQRGGRLREPDTVE